MVTSYLIAEVEIWPFRACIMHPAIIIQFGHCGLGYGVDTTFHRTYFCCVNETGRKQHRNCDCSATCRTKSETKLNIRG